MKEPTDAQRARVHPFRGEAAPLPDAETGARYLKALWTVPQFGMKVTQLGLWKRGIEHAPAPLAQRMEAAIAAFETGAPADDVEVEAVMLAMLDYWSRRGLVIKEAQGNANDRYYPVDAWFIRRWLAAGGIAFALRVLAAFPRIDVDRSKAGANALFVKPRAGAEKWWCFEIGHLGLVHILRRAIASASDYTAGVAEAVRIRETAPLFLRTALAFAFPDEPFWQADLASATPAKKTARFAEPSWGLVTTRVDDAAIPALLQGMARDGQPFVTGTALYGFTLVHRFGDAAARHLIAYLTVVRGEYPKQSFGEALALTETAETRAFFASKLKDKALGKLAKDYVKNA